MASERPDRLYQALAGAEPPPLDEDRGRARFLEAQHASKGRRGKRLWTRVTILAAAAALAVFAAAPYVLPRPLTFTAGGDHGQVGAWLATDNATELPLTFSDGTRIVLQRDSRGRVEHVDRRGARLVLERGNLRADVIHRAGADFHFVAGPFEVLVTGTALSVTWDPLGERFHVAVESGSVVVQGPYVGAERVVRAGERCDVDLGRRTMELGPTASEPDPSPEASSGAPEREASAESPPTSSAPRAFAEPPRKPASAGASWSALEQEGRYEEALAAATRVGPASLYESASSDELLRLALVGQLTGRGDVERDALVACRRRFATSPQAALSAYQLGRTASPGEAAMWFQAYLREQPNGRLAREALGRLIEAYELSGNDAAAREAAASYLARYPSGPHAQHARRVLARGPGKGGK